MQLPLTIPLSTVSCPSGGSAPLPTAFDVVYTSATTGCTDTAPKGITISPAAAPVLFANPATFQPFTAAITPATVGPPPTPAAVTPGPPQIIQLVNNGTAPLDIQSITPAGAGCAQFLAGPAVPPVVTLNQCESLPVNVTYIGSGDSRNGNLHLTIQTNASVTPKTFLLVGTSR